MQAVLYDIAAWNVQVFGAIFWHDEYIAAQH